ncbi:hypothetical protein OW495_17320, partial [Vibrio sp. 14N.309.X.WAT.E.F5]|uniref:hypothetical protein n=1 Tax=Vibrio sp. 14N.309.X.WAT.E.F5 TaxID=2998321 RepID=UPI0025AEDE1D
NLAKVEVIGSNPMYRSKLKSPNRNVRAFWFLVSGFWLLAFSFYMSVLFLFEPALKFHVYLKASLATFVYPRRHPRA